AAARPDGDLVSIRCLTCVIWSVRPNAPRHGADSDAWRIGRRVQRHRNGLFRLGRAAEAHFKVVSHWDAGISHESPLRPDPQSGTGEDVRLHGADTNRTPEYYRHCH